MLCAYYALQIDSSSKTFAMPINNSVASALITAKALNPEQVTVGR
jgi:hypothetical protein